MQKQLFIALFLKVLTEEIKIDTYPGYGWDQLRFLQMNPIYAVMNFNDSDIYRNCIDIIPIYENRIELNSAIMDTYNSTENDYSSNFVMDGSASFFSFKIDGSYSNSYQKIKLQQAQESSITLRNQIDSVLIDVLISNTCPLNAQIKKELIQISNYQKSDQTLLATYAAQLFVKKYGTHVITRVSLGGSIIEEDFIEISRFNRTDTTIRGHRTAAKVSFMKSFNLTSLSLNFGITSNTNFTDTEIEEYEKNITRKLINSKGGDVFTAGTSIDTWQGSLKRYPAILGRFIENMTYIIQSEQIPELSEIDLANLRDGISQAIDTYVQMNVIAGCTVRESASFNWKANVEDGSCVPITQNTQFGGFIRTCSEPSGVYITCSQYRVKNFFTGTETCPPGFQKYLLHNKTENVIIYQRICRSCGFLGLSTCCNNEPTGRGQRVVILYGCGKQDTSEKKSSTDVLTVDLTYVYGGSFTTKKENPVTGTSNCPQEQTFTAVPVTDDLRVCLAERVTVTTDLPFFGGIYSCFGGYNGTNSTTNQQCPEGYSAFVMQALDGTCFLYSCLKFKNFNDHSNLPLVSLPPFLTIPIRNETQNLTQSDDNNSSNSSSLTPTMKDIFIGLSTGALVVSLIACVITIFCNLKKTSNKRNTERIPLN